MFFTKSSGRHAKKSLKGLLSTITALTVSFSALTLAVDSSQEKSQASGFRSTFGTEFWVHWDRNNSTTGFSPRLFIAAASDANVTVTYPNGSSESLTVSAGSVGDVNANEILAAPVAVNQGTDNIRDVGVQVVSDVPVSVYLLNLQTSTSDASIAYPSEFLGTRYRIVTADPVSNAADRFSVLAVEAGTTSVQITPTSSFGARTAGTTFTVSLEQGEAYTAEAADLMGSLVVSDKKVAVSTSGNCANFGRGACDHVTEFLAPTQTWGKSFLLPRTENTEVEGDRYVVVADEDGTTVNINGSDVALDAGDSHFFTGGITSPSVEVVTADKKIAVMQMIDGGRYTDGTTTTTGDPAIIMMVPNEQFLNDVLIATPGTQFVVNQISILAKTSDTGNVTLDGTAVGSGNFTAIAGTDYSVASVNISQGDHRISSTDGFQVYTYGYNSADSYAYAGGTGLVDTVANPGGTSQTGFQSLEQLISASAGLQNVTTTSGDFEYEFSQNGTSYYIVTDQGLTPTTAEIQAAAITGESIYDSGSASTTANTAHTFSLTGLTESTLYSVHAYTVYDDAGTPTDSPIETVDFSTLPGTPTINSITPDDQILTVSISKSGSETGFQYSTDNGATWSSTSNFDSDPKTFNISSLTNGTEYQVKVRSIFNSKAGAATAAQAATPSAASKPDQITAVTATPTHSSVELNWTAPANNNSAITDYKIEYSLDGTTWEVFDDGVSTTTTATVTGLQSLTEYFFRVSAINGVGTSDPSSTVSATTLAPPPYAGPTITDVGNDGSSKPFQVNSGQRVVVMGERLETVSKAMADGRELQIVETNDDHFEVILPEGFKPGVYDLYIESSLGNLTYLDGFVVTDASANFAAANASCEGVETSYWTQRISDTQAKAYIKCPVVGEKYRILQQSGGNGSYNSIFAKTLSGENDTTQVFHEIGRYIVRTIDLEDINRIRIRVDDEELWKVRYNN